MRRKTGTIIGAATVLVAVAALSLSAQVVKHPNFTGTWVMDAAKSDSSSFTPKAATYTVVQRGDSITADRLIMGAAGDTTKSRMVWAVDGRPWKNALPLVGTDVEMTSILSWDKDVLVIHATGTVQGADLVQDDTWRLAPDGKTLLMRRAASYGGHPIGSPTLTFIRQ